MVELHQLPTAPVISMSETTDAPPPTTTQIAGDGALPTQPIPESDNPPIRSSPPKLSLPKLRLQFEDVACEGAQLFLRLPNLSTMLSRSTSTVLSILYGADARVDDLPKTRSITVILRDKEGIAYTTGSRLDEDHKEIHVSTSWLASIPPDRASHEVEGVLVHEIVHCLQYDAHGTVPGGLTEGIADWVRLEAKLDPPHWRRGPVGDDRKWDDGYETTAFFLEWICGRYGANWVIGCNAALGKVEKYEEAAFWKDVCGTDVGELWNSYKTERKEMKEEGIIGPAIETSPSVKAPVV